MAGILRKGDADWKNVPGTIARAFAVQQEQG
jgi:hypothetical protein